MKIVRAAIRHDGMNYNLGTPGARHGDIIKFLASVGLHEVAREGVQGFLTDDDLFVDRFQACQIARAAGQIIKKTGHEDELFSEDLW